MQLVKSDVDDAELEMRVRETVDEQLAKPIDLRIVKFEVGQSFTIAVEEEGVIDDRCDDKRLAGGRDAAPATDKPAFPDAEGGKICRYPSGIDGLPWACAVLSRSGETTGHICEHVLESIGHFSFIVLPNGFIGDGASGLRESAFRGGAALFVGAALVAGPEQVEGKWVAVVDERATQTRTGARKP